MPQGQCVGGGRIFIGVPEQACGAGLNGATHWVDGVASGAFWQVLTSGFAHVGITHILFNMLVLWMLGPSIEQVLGRVRYLAVYFVALIGGSAGVMLFSEPWASVVGASGAIYGLMGALLVLAIRHEGNVRNILVWLGINVAISFTFPNISWEGHLGGLLGGAAVAAILAYLPKERRNLQWPLIGAVAAVFVVIIVARALQLA
ncbi:rhomboid family intramembrane serine protease [Tessaracoccus sp. HDW20]|uniref:rhomboid family intramembrane serine protease n=1 Tax=Tessaracoccus coleopterorum TaxID=2714950 RepID=UPI0018D3DD58|nr:rhomboid family intramembrane serine protease [Tessaracoccus coleopterorum]NHB85032.1 rhomboid family intramembrane serine protease [Tessaracoccus coleopterorum]